MNKKYLIDGQKVTQTEFWTRFFKQMGVEDISFSFPEALFYALEYGEPLPKGKSTYNLIRKALIKECQYSGEELEKNTKIQYSVYTQKHVPHPFIDSIQETLGSLNQDDLEQGKFKSMIQDGIRARLKEYNAQGVCTLGLADYAKVSTDKEFGYGEDEHEAV